MNSVNVPAARVSMPPIWNDHHAAAVVSNYLPRRITAARRLTAAARAIGPALTPDRERTLAMRAAYDRPASGARSTNPASAAGGGAMRSRNTSSVTATTTLPARKQPCEG